MSDQGSARRAREWRTKNRKYALEKIRAYLRNRRANDPLFVEQAREYQRNRRANDPSYTKRHKERHRDHKLEALEHYGGPNCAYCGETNIDLLHLDHTNGGGAKHRLQLIGRRTGGGGDLFYRVLKRLHWPTKHPLQWLCRSCHGQKTYDERIIKAWQAQPHSESLYQKAPKGQIAESSKALVSRQVDHSGQTRE